MGMCTLPEPIIAILDCNARNCSVFNDAYTVDCAFFIQILTSVILQMDVMSMPIAIIIPARIAVPANLDSLAMENLANVRYMFNNPVTHPFSFPSVILCQSIYLKKQYHKPYQKQR